MSLCLIIPYRIILFLIFLIFLRFFIMRFGHSFFQNPLTTRISSGSYAATVTYRAETGFLELSESAFQRCVHPRGAFFVEREKCRTFLSHKKLPKGRTCLPLRESKSFIYITAVRLYIGSASEVTAADVSSAVPNMGRAGVRTISPVAES